MEINSVYSGMVNMRKLTKINPAALASPPVGSEAGKSLSSVGSERRRHNDRRSSDKKD